MVALDNVYESCHFMIDEFSIFNKRLYNIFLSFETVNKKILSEISDIISKNNIKNFFLYAFRVL